MQKAFNSFPWRNYPSTDSPLNEQNLMKINNGLDIVDDRVISLDTTKFDKTEAQGLIKNITFDLQTGILKKYYYNGSTEEINTGISKLNMNLRFDRENQILYIVNADGTEDPVDLSVFITNHEFEDSDTIAHNVSSSGTVTSIVKEGSIQEKHLRPDYLADIRVESAKAESSRDAAAQSAENANTYADLSKSYAVGTDGQVRPNDAEDNAKKYSEKSESNANTAKEYLTKVEKAGEDAVQAVKDALDIDAPNFLVDLSTGNLMYSGGRFVFNVNDDGHLEWGLAI